VTVDVEISGPEQAVIRGLREPCITIGRDAQNLVALRHGMVSRRHAVVEVEEGGMWLSNLGANGTLLAGRPVEGRTPLPSGAEVRIAQYVLRLFTAGLLAEPAPEAAPPAIPPDDARLLALRRGAHRRLLERMNLQQLAAEDLRDERLRPRVEAELDRILWEMADDAAPAADHARLKKELCDEALGLGPLSDLLADTRISEIMVLDRHTVYVEREGRLERAPCAFSSDESLRAAIERIVTPLGRRIDESQPLVDARLPDGSRVNAIIPPLAIRGCCLTIRKFTRRRLDLASLVELGTLDARMARLLERAVLARRNIVISGGTGSGKTTLLGVLAHAIASEERIVTVEDAAELRLAQPHVVSLETRPANMEGRGDVTIRDLVRNCLRMRPDRIIVGECRGGEALDMLQAMNTGHDGSLTTLHANSPREALARLETLCLMAGLDLPARAVREQIAASVHLVVQVARLSDGSRRITAIAEVGGLDDDGRVVLEEIFTFARRTIGAHGSIAGEFRATGYLPGFLGDLVAQGRIQPEEVL
jgi:pilus assembly protein CpaF